MWRLVWRATFPAVLTIVVREGKLQQAEQMIPELVVIGIMESGSHNWRRASR
jgi:hypothetical protein